LDRDRIGRALPVWQGCRGSPDGQLILMNLDAPDSLDRRYFGPIPATAVIARALPLWTDEDGNRRFVWPAPTRCPHPHRRAPAPDSLDGRYFGPIPASAVIGRALPLWTDEDGNGRFVWRAPTR